MTEKEGGKVGRERVGSGKVKMNYLMIRIQKVKLKRTCENYHGGLNFKLTGGKLTECKTSGKAACCLPSKSAGGRIC